MKNTIYIFTIGVLLSFFSCDSDDINQIFSRGENDNNAGQKMVSKHCDFEVSYNEIGKFFVVYNLEALSSGKGYKPEDQTGKFTKFDLENGKITESETEWDIAFRYSTIVLNGGEKTGRSDEPSRTAKVSAYIAESPFEQLKTVSQGLLQMDKKGKLAITDDVLNKKGLWSYSMTYHYVLPIPGRTVVFKTRNGKYVKMQIKSFYKCVPEMPKPADESYGYYTFRYVEIK